MKVQNITDIEGFFKVVDSCEGKVELVTGEGDRLNLKSKLSQYVIGFNPKFLIDALRVIDDEEISIYLVNPKAPCFIRNEEESYIYLILPVNFNSVR